jgi:hypothetical protein
LKKVVKEKEDDQTSSRNFVQPEAIEREKRRM